MNSNYSYLETAVSKIEEALEKEGLTETLRNSVKGYLFMLASADKIAPAEIRFINDALDEHMDEESAARFLKKAGINKEYAKNPPEIVEELQELAFVSSEKSADILYVVFGILDLYKNLGLELLSADEKVTQKELKCYTDYMHQVIEPLRKKVQIQYDVVTEDEEDEEYEEETPEESEESFDELMGNLDALTGLENVKNEIRLLVNLAKVRKMREEKGLKNLPVSFHMVFTGNPGTGKTTVARLLSKIFRSLGILSKGHLVETDRSGLVAGYMGQTAIKTKEVIDSAVGGILFIDEAYSLTYGKNGEDYGAEAVDTIIKYMEDKREDLIIIVAGYPKEMAAFINSNPGLKSRFTRYVSFENYKPEELYGIFEHLAENNNYKVTPSAKEKLLSSFENMTEEEISKFGNARGVRNLFENAVMNQASRIVNISPDEESLVTITEEDI